MSIFNNILFCTDLTDVNFNVAEDALKIAKQNDAAFNLIHVINNVPIYVESLENAVQQEANNRLYELTNKLKIQNENIYLKTGSSKFEIIETAKEIGTDLIIVGSHSQHGFFGSLGSIATGVVNNAPCHVLVLKTA